MIEIPFNKPYLTGQELRFIAEAHSKGQLSGDGEFTKSCSRKLEAEVGSKAALLTHSCTASLEMCAILLGIGPGDEVIMPSYTFVSTANAFVLLGAKPVFVDIREDTLNLDERLIEDAITPNTKAVVAVHYAGVGCDMDAILKIAVKARIAVIEDAAQAFKAAYKKRPLGGIGSLGCFSFHETKNVISGEGGALIVNDREFIERARIIWEKGTNRSKFMNGEVDKYTWIGKGSSYLPGELTAAFLYAQLDASSHITSRRLAIWNQYHEAFRALELEGKVRRPFVPEYCEHNGHMYYLIMRDEQERNAFITFMRERSIQCIFHYIPLHSSPGGAYYGRSSGSMEVTDDISCRIVRLPLWIGVENHQPQIIDSVNEFFKDLMI